MKFRVILSLLAMASSIGTLLAQPLVGDWSGKLKLGGGRNLRLVFHIADSPKAIAMDSPD